MLNAAHDMISSSSAREIGVHHKKIILNHKNFILNIIKKAKDEFHFSN